MTLAKNITMYMPDDLITIIVPTFNRELLITETMDSILAQTYQNWECIIVDDGSTDDTIKVVEKYVNKDERFKLFQRNRNPKGAPTCRNIGISKVKGNYFMFLDSDDKMAPFCLENRIILSHNFPNYDAWVFRSVYIENGEILDKEFYFEDSFEKLSEAFLIRPQWAMNGPLFQTDKFLKYKISFDERLPFWQDWTFFLDALLQGLNFLRFSNQPPDVYIRIHSDGVRISKSKRIDSQKIDALYKHIFFIFNELDQNGGINTNVFIYRMYYLYGYLIHRQNYSSVIKGIQLLDEYDFEIPLKYKLLRLFLIQAVRIPINSRILSYLVHLVNESLKNNIIKNTKQYQISQI